MAKQPKPVIVTNFRLKRGHGSNLISLEVATDPIHAASVSAGASQPMTINLLISDQHLRDLLHALKDLVPAAPQPPDRMN
jgi:hypothetical protein